MRPLRRVPLKACQALEVLVALDVGGVAGAEDAGAGAGGEAGGTVNSHGVVVWPQMRRCIAKGCSVGESLLARKRIYGDIHIR